MNMHKTFAIAITFAVVVGGSWYGIDAYRAARVSRDGTPLPVDRGVMRLPTTTPHVVGPTSSPPFSPDATSSKPVVLSSGIRGSVSIGPTCPVERIPPDPQCADRPYATTFVATNAKGVVVKTFSSDGDGKFEVVLPAGEYSVGPATQTMFPRAGFQDVVVQAGAFTEITIEFDSGIR